MRPPASPHMRHRFPGELISLAAWLYYRFLLDGQGRHHGGATTLPTIHRSGGAPSSDRTARTRARM